MTQFLKSGCISPGFLSGGNMNALAPVAWYDESSSRTIDALNRVAQWNDLTANAYHVTQAVDGSKPVLSRSDNKENRVYSSQVLSDSTYWLQTGNVAITANDAVAPDGTTTAEKIADDTTNGQHYTRVTDSYRPTYINGGSYVMSAYVKAGTKGKVRLFAGHTSYRTADFNVATGAVITQSNSTPSIEDAGNGWYRCSMAFTAAGAGVGPVNIYLLKDDTAADSYIGTGTYLYVWGAQLRPSTAASTYIATTTYPQYSGINGRPALVFDGTDDHLRADALATAFTGEDKPYTVIAVLQPAVSTVSKSFMGWGNSSGAAQQIFHRQRQPGLVDNAAAAKYQTDGTPTAGAVAVATITSTGKLQNFYENGTLKGAADYDVDVGTLTLNRGAIGGTMKDVLVDIWQGKIAEVVVFNKALSAGDLNTVQKYLGAKWGVTVA